MLRQHGLRRGRLEWCPPSNHLEQHTPHRVDVRTPVHIVLTKGLLRAHVRRRAHGHPGAGEFLAACDLHGAGNSKIRDDSLVASEQDVLRFDVAMNDALLVRVR